MRKNKFILKSGVVISFLLTILCKPTYSQVIETGREMQELVRIAQVYESTPNLNFRMRFTYADSLTWETIIRSDTFYYKLSNGKTFITSNEMEMLQGNEYMVYVDKVDSMIFVNQRQTERSTFQVPLLDSTFRAAHVEDMYVEVIEDTIWRFGVNFKAESPYLYYDMRYNPKTAMVQSVNYHIKNLGGVYDIPADHVICATFYMSHYSDADQDPAIFNERRYFYKLNGALYLQTAWQQFQLQNQ